MKRFVTKYRNFILALSALALIAATPTYYLPGLNLQIYGSNLATAITAISTTRTGLRINTAITLSASATVPATLELYLTEGGKITLGNYNLVINGAFHGSPGCFVQTGSGKVTFGPTAVKYAEPLWWGADLTGTNDSIAALNAALASTSSVYLQLGTYRLASGLTTTAPSSLWSDGFVPSSSADESTVGAVLVGDLAVPTLVTLDGTGGNAHEGCGLRGITITRAAGTIPDSTVGLLIKGGYNTNPTDVLVMRNAINVEWLGGNGGIKSNPLRLFTSQAKDAHWFVDDWPELRAEQCHLGSVGSGDLSCNAYIRFSGTGYGPNTFEMVNCHANQGQSAANTVATFLDFINFSGATTLFKNFRFIGQHVENAAYIVQTDSSVSLLNRLEFLNSEFIDNPGTGEFWHLNAATGLDSFKLTGGYVGHAWTLAPGVQINGMQVSTTFAKAVSVTGISNSTVGFENCTYMTGLTVGGFFAGAKFSGMITGGSLTNNAGLYYNVAGSTANTFTASETVTQGTTGATAVVYGTVPSAGPMVLTTIVGAPDASHTWVGASSGAVFTPTSLPNAAKVEFDFPNISSDWTTAAIAPTIQFSTSQAATYSVQSAQYKIHGRLCTYQFKVSMAKSTSSGNATLHGLPFTPDSTFAISGGSMADYVTGMLSLSGPLLLNPATTGAVNLYQMNGTTGVAQLTDANFGTGTCVIDGTIQFAF